MVSKLLKLQNSGSIEFNKYGKQIRPPFLIYAGFENIPFGN